jgi:hypothetical protein
LTEAAGDYVLYIPDMAELPPESADHLMSLGQIPAEERTDSGFDCESSRAEAKDTG